MNSFCIDLSNLIQENLFDHDLNIDEYKFSICKFYITEIQYYDNSTFYDKYGTAMAAIQLKNGSIADISFIKETKKLTSFRLSEEYFALTEVEFEDGYYRSDK